MLWFIENADWPQTSIVPQFTCRIFQDSNIARHIWWESRLARVPYYSCWIWKSDRIIPQDYQGAGSVCKVNLQWKPLFSCQTKACWSVFDGNPLVTPLINDGLGGTTGPHFCANQCDDRPVWWSAGRPVAVRMTTWSWGNPRWSGLPAAEVESALATLWFPRIFWHVFWPPFFGGRFTKWLFFRLFNQIWVDLTTEQEWLLDSTCIGELRYTSLHQLRWIKIIHERKPQWTRQEYTPIIQYHMLLGLSFVVVTAIFWRSIKKRFVTFQQELGSLREGWLEKGIDTILGIDFFRW